jgi:hypothetical protein
MGIVFSKQSGGNTSGYEKLNTEKHKLPNILDHIAVKYILTQNFKDLENLHNKEYCNKLVILTSKIIKKYFNDTEISVLEQRTQNGAIINKMTEDKKISFITRNDFEKMQQITPLRKQRMCIGIAKFYIKIAHIFAAITKTINPLYEYTNNLGQQTTVELKEKNKLTKDFKVKFRSVNLCSRRIAALMTRQNNENGIAVKPKICSVNLKGGVNQTIPDITTQNKETDETTISENEEDVLNTLKKQVKSTKEIKSLSEDIGIPELEKLYWDDYDYNTGKYNGMLPETEKIYLDDVHKFYKAFTGKQSVPDTIKHFSDIPLNDFHNDKLCLDRSDPKYNTLSEDEKKVNFNWNKTHGPSKNNEYVEYAGHISTMIKHTKSRESALKDVLGKIFVYWVDGDKKTLTINPELNNKNLEELVVKTRNIIIELYISCEKDFKKGLALFEKIVFGTIFKTRQRKDARLKQMTNEFMN